MRIEKQKISLAQIYSFVIIIGFAFFICLNLTGTVSAAISINSPNASLELNASLCINDSYKIMDKLSGEGFAVKRINDTIKSAEQVFAAQITLKSKARNYDFSPIIVSCDEIKSLSEDAFKARDEISSLMKFYEDSITEKMNSSSIDAVILEIQGEMKDERYEKVAPLVDKAYSEIINVQSAYTALNVFYQSTATGIKAFFGAKNRLFQIPNWAVILIFAALFLVTYFIYRIKISIWILNRKIEKLKIRKGTIKNLVMKTQKDYFQTGRISEGDYNIKVKKFAELIRDIDRQIPLLQEELAKLQKVKFKK